MTPVEFIEEMSVLIGSLVQELQDTAVEVISAPGGHVLLIAGILGVCVLGFEVLLLLSRAVRRLTRRAPSISTPAERAVTLLRLGGKPAEVARAVGLSRDALTLVIPEEFSRGTPSPDHEPPALPVRRPWTRNRLLSA